MPTILNPYTGDLEIVPKSSGGNNTPPLPAVHITADDTNVATEAQNNLRLAGGTGIATTASGNQVNVLVNGDVTLTYKPDDNSLNHPSSSVLTVLGDATSGITTTGTGSGLKVQAVNATTTQKGVANFNPTHFTVTTGQVNAKLASTSAAGYASFDTAAFGVDGTGRVTFIKPDKPDPSFATDSGSATLASNTLTIHGTTGLGISGAGATVTIALQAATSSALGAVIPGAQFTIDGSGNLTLNTVGPAKGGTGLANPTAGRIPLTNGSSNFTLAQVNAGQIFGGSSTGPKALGLVGAGGIQVTADDNNLTVRNQAAQTWQNSTGNSSVSNGRNYVFKGSSPQTTNPQYDPNRSSQSIRIIGASANPYTIVPYDFTGSGPDTLLLNGQTATTQIQAVEPWAACELICVAATPIEIIPGTFAYQCTWQVLPLVGNFTIS